MNLVSSAMQVRVSVYMNSVSYANNNARPVFERVIDWDDSLKFPFESLVAANKALFGQKCITVIELS